MPQEFLTQNELTQIYTTLLIDKSLDNQKLAISSLQKIYGSKVEHNVPLLGYANNTLDTLFQESFHNQKLSYQCLNFLSILKSYSPAILFPESTVVELFCGLLQSSSSTSVVKEMAQIYLKTLFPEYSAKPDK